MRDDDEKKSYLPEEEEEEGGGKGSDDTGPSSQRDGDFLDFSLQREEGEEGEGKAGAGGAVGEIEFRYKDPFSVSPRDDQLPPQEIKRLLSVHKDQHKGHVDKQKQTRKERAAVKDGKQLFTRQIEGKGFGVDRVSSFKTHPIALKAQFSGIDKQVSHLPTNNEALTNDQLKNELENRLDLKLGLTHKPSAAPRPRPT